MIVLKLIPFQFVSSVFIIFISSYVMTIFIPEVHCMLCKFILMQLTLSHVTAQVPMLIVMK
jgi:hypothetical protein